MRPVFPFLEPLIALPSAHNCSKKIVERLWKFCRGLTAFRLATLEGDLGMGVDVPEIVTCPNTVVLLHLSSSGLRTAFLLLLLVSATWLLGLMAVNSDVMTFHYLFAIFSCLQVSRHIFCLSGIMSLDLPHASPLMQS